MKRSFGVWLSLAVALACGLPFLVQTSRPSASTPLYRHPSPSASKGENPAPRAVPHATTDAGNTEQVELPQRDMAALKEEVAFLRREVATVQRQLHEQQQMALTIASGKEEEPALTPLTISAARAAAERERQEQMALLEANFRREPTDQQWSFRVGGAVHEALAENEAVQTALRNIECHSSTCRVELADNDGDELAKDLPVFLQQLGDMLPHVTANQVADGAGGQLTILYLFRESR